MTKKQKISDKLQAKFDKPQFRIGDAVFFSWLGQKQYGYVIRIKKNSWGVQYSVESCSGIKYPCGIQIQGQKTNYNTGYIFFEETKSLGDTELRKRIQNTPKHRRATTVSINSAGSKDESTIHNSNGGGDDANNDSKTRKTRKKRVSKSNAVSSSTSRTDTDNTKKRKGVRNSELDAAIEKQRNFLSGFVKKE
jgi:myo-inositol-1-phosphate synthase